MMPSFFKKHKFKHLSLIQKFILTYCLLILIPLVILFGYTYSTMSQMSYNNIVNLAEQSFLQARDFLDYKLLRIFDISNSILLDPDLTDILLKDPNDYPLIDQIKDLRKLRNFASSYQDRDDVINVSIYVNDEFMYSNDNTNIFKMSSLKDTNALEYITNNSLRFLWFTQETDSSNYYLSFLKTIKNPDDLSQDIGYLILNFDREKIQDIVNKTNSIDGSISYIVDSDGEIVISSHLSDDYTKYPNLDTIKYYADNNLPLSKTNINNENIYIQSTALNKTDWYLVNVLPESCLLSEINTQRSFLILIALFCGSTSILISIIFIKSIKKRLSKVITGMQSVHEGDFTHYIEDDNDDELSELTKTYNYMIKTISALNKQQYINGQAVKNAELKALQSQINPHFLYNTLDMINWMSYKNMNSEIRVAIKNLAKFYKLSLNKGEDLTSIDDELLHSSLYVEIQNMRYNNRINLMINVQDTLKAYNIPKITLQPIIENAINHGILAKGGEDGTILISGYTQDEDIILQISDDGIGIPPDVIDLILSENAIRTNGSGYGLRNINTRIKLRYGNDYGISFISNYNFGTTVQIKLPKSN